MPRQDGGCNGKALLFRFRVANEVVELCDHLVEVPGLQRQRGHDLACIEVVRFQFDPVARRAQCCGIVLGEGGDLDGTLGNPRVAGIQCCLQVVGYRNIQPAALTGDLGQQHIEQHLLAERLNSFP